MHNGRRQMAVWPLIKVVRVYMKSHILSGGVTLVDLVSPPPPAASPSARLRSRAARRQIRKPLDGSLCR